jgi:hypothetical protein
MPALLTRMSMRPRRRRASSTSARTAASTVTSARSATARPMPVLPPVMSAVRPASLDAIGWDHTALTSSDVEC